MENPNKLFGQPSSDGLWRSASSMKKALIGPWPHRFPTPTEHGKEEVDDKTQNALDNDVLDSPMLCQSAPLQPHKVGPFVPILQMGLRKVKQALES